MKAYDKTLSYFDLDMERGRQGELFVLDVADMLAKRSATIEVKTDAKFVITENLYVEYECRGRDGQWRSSGIATTKAQMWTVVFGKHPGMMTIDTDWLKRAARIAFRDSRRVACVYGENPTRGVLVTWDDLLKARDTNLDEHK